MKLENIIHLVMISSISHKAVFSYFCYEYLISTYSTFHLNFSLIHQCTMPMKRRFAGLGNTTESGQKFTTEDIGKLLIIIKLTTDL